jgi:hypothetical protein
LKYILNKNKRYVDLYIFVFVIRITMMKTMKTTFTLFCFILLVSGLQAGFSDPTDNTNTIPPSGNEEETTDPASGGSLLFGDLSGVILDENTDEPVEFATIGIYNKEDSSLVTSDILMPGLIRLI